MKIIIANYRYFVAGGPEKYMFKFIQIAQEHGIECIPFSVQYEQNKPTPYSKYFVQPRGDSKTIHYEDIRMTPCSVWRMLNCTIYNFEAKRKMKELIRATKPDCVYIIHEINSLSPSIIDAAKEEGVRVVHRISDFFLVCANRELLCEGEICDACVGGKLSKAFQTRCVKNSLMATITRIIAMKTHKFLKVFNKVDAWVIPSSFTRGMLIRGGLCEDKAHHVPTFINVDEIEPCYEHDGYVLFLGRMSHEKGVIYAIQAMYELTDTPIKLKITGNPDPVQDKECIDYIQEHKLKNVDFVGFKQGDELKKLIGRAMCVVCPAIWYENMPNTVVESYAYGKSVIASRLGSLAEIVEDEKTGYLFEPKNSKELAQKIRIYLENPDIAISLGKNARLKCETEFGAEKHFERVLKLLKGEA